jgi:peptidoglycan pentaglycine glycine transferase (the second and third glycine)
MIFTEINEEEFKHFSEIVSCHNFFQTVMTIERLKENNEEYYLVGVKEGNQVIGATILVVQGRVILGKKVFNAFKGPLLDYHNKVLLDFFITNLKQFVSQHNGYLLLIYPYIVSQTRDTDGNIVPNGINNLDVKDNLLNLGCTYVGEYIQAKWNYCLDINNLSKEEIFKTFKPNTRNNINKTLNKYLLNVRKLNYDELAEFKKVTEDTCQRRGFPDKSLKYYQDMYKCFKDDVVFYLCELNIDTYVKHLDDEDNISNSKIKELSDSPSNRNKKIALEEEIKGNNKRRTEALNLKKTKGNVIPLSAAMFMLFGDEIIYLFSGSYDEYMSFCGQYRLQWEIISYACDHHYRRYNFFGIKDLFNPQGKDYGVYEFKKGFNGYVEELLGTFALPINNLGKLYDSYKKMFKK